MNRRPALITALAVVAFIMLVVVRENRTPTPAPLPPTAVEPRKEPPPPVRAARAEVPTAVAASVPKHTSPVPVANLEDIQQRLRSLPAGSLSQSNSMVLLRSLEAIGFAAHTNDAAWTLIQEMAQTSHWANVKWHDDNPNTPVIWAIAALGCSGRPEIPTLLERMKDRPDVKEISGALVDAAYADDIIRTHGHEFFLQTYGDGNGLMRFQEWLKTENGKAWQKWRSEKIGLPQQ